MKPLGVALLTAIVLIVVTVPLAWADEPVEGQICPRKWRSATKDGVTYVCSWICRTSDNKPVWVKQGHGCPTSVPRGTGSDDSGGGAVSPSQPNRAEATAPSGRAASRSDDASINMDRLNQQLRAYGISPRKVTVRVVEGLVAGDAYVQVTRWWVIGTYTLAIGTTTPGGLKKGTDVSVYDTLRTEEKWAWLLCTEVRHMYQWENLGAPTSPWGAKREWKKWELEANGFCNIHWPEFMGIYP